MFSAPDGRCRNNQDFQRPSFKGGLFCLIWMWILIKKKPKVKRIKYYHAVLLIKIKKV